MELSSAVLPVWTTPILLAIIVGLLAIIWNSIRTFMGEHRANTAALNTTVTKVEIFEKQLDKISNLVDDVAGLKYVIETYIKTRGKAK